MDSAERRDIIRTCRTHGYTDLARWHENQLREQEKRK